MVCSAVSLCCTHPLSLSLLVCQSSSFHFQARQCKGGKGFSFEFAFGGFFGFFEKTDLLSRELRVDEERGNPHPGGIFCSHILFLSFDSTWQPALPLDPSTGRRVSHLSNLSVLGSWSAYFCLFKLYEAD